MEGIAIKADNIWKIYRKHRRINKYETLKGMLLGRMSYKRSPDEYIHALKHVSFKVRKGESVAIIGSNGSGKSTLLKIVASICLPSAGIVEVNGKVSALIELGAGFHPEISGRENIFINGIMLGLTKAQVKERFDSIVNFAELWESIDNPVKTYSSGMYMRLGFSVAIHVDPQILLIDEVLAVGDEAFVHKCIDKIYQFRRQGKTILLVTHGLEAVKRLCDRAIWLEKGTIQIDAEPNKVIGHYLHHVHQKEEERYASLQAKSQQIIDSGIEYKPSERKKDTSEQQAQEQTEEKVKEPKCILDDDGNVRIEGLEVERWGSREIELCEIRMLDDKDKQRNIYNSGDKITIEMHFLAHKQINDPVFGVGIYTASGTWCYGTNTAIEGYKIATIKKGSGVIKFVIERLDLVEGSYYLDFAVHSRDGFPYDYQSKLHVISVRSEIKDFGVFRPPHRWTFPKGLRVESKGNHKAKNNESD